MSKAIEALKLLRHKLDNYDGEGLGSLAVIADEAIGEVLAAPDKLAQAVLNFVVAVESTNKFSIAEFKAWRQMCAVLDEVSPEQCECEESPEYGKLTCEMHKAGGG